MPITLPSLAHSRDALRDALLSTVDLLKRRRAAEVAQGYFDDYVALNWLEWNGGSLQLTTTGENLCRHLASQLGLEPDVLSETRGRKTVARSRS